MVGTTDHGEQTDVAFLDFSKAYDSVSHAHLITKLDQSGIKGSFPAARVIYRYNYINSGNGHRKFALRLVALKPHTKEVYIIGQSKPSFNVIGQ